jgi:hypothetical protein
MITEPVTSVAVRIKFAGSQDSETLHMTRRECARFHSDWTAYLAGNGAIGGEYATDDAGQALTISLNFSLIAYIEPGKTY